MGALCVLAYERPPQPFCGLLTACAASGVSLAVLAPCRGFMGRCGLPLQGDVVGKFFLERLKSGSLLEGLTERSIKGLQFGDPTVRVRDPCLQLGDLTVQPTYSTVQPTYSTVQLRFLGVFQRGRERPHRVNLWGRWLVLVRRVVRHTDPLRP